MAYKLVCIHEFFDEISGKQINRGEEIYDYTHIAKLVAANREHQFNKVFLTMADTYWDWPPKVPEETPPQAPPEPQSIAPAAYQPEE